MEPTYPPGSRLRVDRRAYLRSPPARGEVVVVEREMESSPFMKIFAKRKFSWDLKRIIGLPGEEVSWGHGELRVNGRPLEEPYARSPPAPPGDDEMQARRLGEGEYFVMGDNRLHSTDSRHYGPVKRDRIMGRGGR